MSVSTSQPAKPTSVAKASAKSDVKVAEQVPEVVGPNRREFLFYIWGASIALFGAASGASIIWYLLPRFEEGEFGGIIRVSGSVPGPDDPPIDNPSGKFFLSNSEDGLVALYKVCTHLGCLYAWVEANGRYECPCHGSKYERNGKWIEGPAPRSLDRFAITIQLSSGERLESNEAGDPVPIQDPLSVTEVVVDTGKRIKRPGRV
ncbi:MAG: hypothetical protein CUN55_05895 [Phototrophicales bacterium]|nr:MAG: hypothetical protein CUN55_05895 [Phototrophicales bacterium]